MQEGTRTALLKEGHLEEEIVKQAEAAVEEASPGERVRAGLEAVVEVAETDPAAARSALLELRGDHEALARVEEWLGGDPRRAAFGLGAALQVAVGELASPKPDLRGRMAELLIWLEGDW